MKGVLVGGEIHCPRESPFLYVQQGGGGIERHAPGQVGPRIACTHFPRLTSPSDGASFDLPSQRY